ncbi:MAG: leucine--tRNA ligase [DPANN group archaeon]|nr:leucine--tRNA ligase [DPANN group archaeon]
MEFQSIEKKWQKAWEDKKIFHAKEDSKKKKFYNLEMFPYPSASFLHMGHVRNYTIGDVIARFKRMQGFNVLYPMGYDSFGLPAENAAKKSGIHPKKYTEDAIKKITEYFKAMGNSYDWSRTISTHEPEYYKWNQWFFLKFLERGLVYRKKAPVNWCHECKSTLANEEVVDGCCWRHETTKVEQKELEQWFIKTTAYADELLKDLDKLNWSDRLKHLQRNWIGKSDGLLFSSPVKGSDIILQTFSTHFEAFKADTFIAIAPDHPLLQKLLDGVKNKNEILEFCKKIIQKRKTQKEPEIEGIFTGRYTIDPVGNGELPIWVTSFAIADYGTGIVKCSAHDQRDFEFAKKHNIRLKAVLVPQDPALRKKVENFEICYTDMKNGLLTEPKEFTGKKAGPARQEIIDYCAKQNLAKQTTNYKLRDWLISRQRYWGTPIPIIYCGKCGAVPVPEKELPVLLPEKVDFKVQGNPIASATSWAETKCPKCKSPAKRETDTMGGFVDSSWYFLRYCSPKEKKLPFTKKAVDYWMPVNQYIGGIEHAVGHLIYSRFWTKVLRDMKLLNFDEPFAALFNQGIVYKDGHKMSKSFGNVVYQTDISEKYGIDTARVFLMSVGAPESDMEWSDSGVEGAFRLLQKISKIAELKFKKPDAKDDHKRNILIKNYTQLLETLKFNLAIIELARYADYLAENPTREGYETLLTLLSPFAPHTAEELWHEIRNKSFVSVEQWPAVDEKAISKEIEQQEQILEKTIEDMRRIIKIVNKAPKKIYLYAIPKELDLYKSLKETLQKEFSAEIEVWANNNIRKYDPEHKAEKAKPGKPGIYIET